MDDLHQVARIAYFSMEIAVAAGVPTYSGGLGVLAGDLMRSSADLALPMVGVTLVSRLGYLRQEIVDGRQVEKPHPWSPESLAQRVAVKVPVRIGTREVWVGAWKYMVGSRCASGHPVPVLLLDTDLPENTEEDRHLTDVLYGGGDHHRLAQEIVLGVGGVRLLAALGVRVLKYHLNEGHAALLALELLRLTQENGAGLNPAQTIASVQRQCIFTTHTPVPAGQDQFEYGMALPCLGGLVEAGLLRSLGGQERLNMTMLAFNLSGWVNGVAQRHAETSRALFPGYEVHAITNGVHPWTWASEAHRELYDRSVPQWCHEPELLMNATRIDAGEFSAAHARAKDALIAYAAQAVPGAKLQRERLTIGYARRMTNYKRPHLLFADLKRLRRISGHQPLQIVLAGKAHPRDAGGKKHIENVHLWARELAPDVPVTFLPDYDMDVARLMVAGCDVWLNTPQPPMEASGTSGMKAAVNGVPSLSVLDGWWVEGWSEGITGWAVPGSGNDLEDARALHDRIEQLVAPLFYGNPSGWQELMRNVVARNGAFFNSHRMLRRYTLEAYLALEPAAVQGQTLVLSH